MAGDSYTAVHAAMLRQRGKASEHSCVKCGNQAAEWAYDHRDPNERQGIADSRGTVVTYSTDMDHYRPLCRSCHKSEDQWNRKKTHCKHGHEFTPENTYVWRGRRSCRACNRRLVAERKARLTGVTR